MNKINGIKLWNKAKKIIPGGSQMLSKRSEMFLPEQWPSYYKKAKGVNIWDLNDNKYIDMSIMGIGSCILGYADDTVNDAVYRAIKNGNMSILNCYEEVELAELLLEINPWADMVKYARTGGEAAAIAIRIARASSKKDNIAFCGYHGWHDWYLAANLANETNLDGHLLPGLDPSGVPRGLKGTAIPFKYNDIEQFESIINNYDIGAIILEPIRNFQPKKEFISGIREIASEKEIPLIIDEVSAGWRLNIGGAHSYVGIEPDIAIYAKAMSNGFPMAAIVGKYEFMDMAQTSFISSTYWTERIGPVASLATINRMIDVKLPSHLVKIGEMIMNGWKKLADEHEINLHTFGIPPLAHFSFDYKNNQDIRTLFTQEMMKFTYLASNAVYVSYMHTTEVVERYLENVDNIFRIIKSAIEENQVKNMLKGPTAHSGFHRLN